MSAIMAPVQGRERGRRVGVVVAVPVVALAADEEEERGED